jgi:hypothetical protein
MDQLPAFHPMIVGRYCFGMNIVCHDGQIRWVTVEQYQEGFKAILKVDGEEMTKRSLFKTSRKAVNAAAGWVSGTSET